ncbi:MAG: hypothetical protein KGH72_01885 [Candidatus Micrarchaeota archaeon]|nr:hypothetical protein [Candidatus Micrarchaeota archaeon]
MKIQIALDYLIIFNFVIFLFLIVFIAVAYQRGQATNQETFSQLQIIAQTVAAQINIASASGNGFASHIVLPGSISIISYNLSISNTGLVIVSVNTNGQVIQALAYSMVNRVLSNTSYQWVNNPNLYNIPTTNGSLELQNSFGNICIDYNCPPPINQSTMLAMTSAVSHAATFTGSGSTYLDASAPHGITYTAAGGVSACMWFNTANVVNSQSPFGEVPILGGSGIDFYLPNAGSVTPTLSYTHLRWETSPGSNFFSVSRIYPNRWYLACGTWSSGTGKLYINGTIDNSSAISFGTGASAGNIVIGAESYPPLNFPFNGAVMNFQLYNTTLTASQVKNLYYEGITGQPVSNSLVGWWPLNGNGQDWSGIGNAGQPQGSVAYTAVAQFYAKAANLSGTPIANTLVGFTYNLGNATTSGEILNYTNSTGIASVIVGQGSAVSGSAFVRATAFQAANMLTANLIGWWPLDFGQGSLAYDISGNNNTANMYNSSWDRPNYYAYLNGKNNLLYINISAANAAQYTMAKSHYVLTYWIKTLAPSNYTVAGLSSGGRYTPTGRWTFVAFEWTGSSCNFYVDTVLEATLSSCTAMQPGINGPSFFYGANSSTRTYVPEYLSNIQLYDTVLAQAQINTLYQGGLAAPPITLSGSFLVGWWPLDGDAMDHSGYGNIGNFIVNGVTLPSYSAGFVPASNLPQGNNITNIYSASLNGANAFLYGSNRYNPSTEQLGVSRAYVFPFSAFEWVRPNGASFPGGAGQWQLLGVDGGIPELSTYGLGVLNTGGNIVVENGATSYIASNLVLPLQRWSLVGLTMNATSATVYLNEQRQAIPITPAGILSTWQYWTVGGNATGSGAYFPGNISDVQIYNGIVNASQEYKMYTQGVTSPPVPNRGLVGWWPLAANFSDFSGVSGALSSPYYISGGNTFSEVTFALNPIVNPPNINSFHSTGVALNGFKSTIVAPVSRDPVTSAVTISAWVNGDNNNLFTAHGSVVNASTKQLSVSSNTIYFWPDTADTGYFLSAKYNTTGTWNHIVAEWNYTSKSGAIYVNGWPVATGGSGAPAAKSITTVTIGGPRNMAFNGSISNVQIFDSYLTQAQIYQLYDNSPPQSAAVQLNMVTFQ